jgi:hypothetical protein
LQRRQSIGEVAWAPKLCVTRRQESDADSVTGADDIVGNAYQVIVKLAMSTKEANLTHVFAWGYQAWLTQRSSGFSLSGYIDGREFDIVTDTPQGAERAFARAARSAWLRRKLRRLRGLPARESPPIGTLDTYHEVTLRTIFVAVVTALWSRVR